MNTPLFKKVKQNGTTLYVFPSVAEDKNYERQNENYSMSISHFAFLNFPREVVNSKLDFENAFYQNGTSIAPADFKDRLVESLRNYIANHTTTIRNSKLNSTDFYYDANEAATVDEKIFWKWAKSVGCIDFEPADDINEYFGGDSKYDDNGPIGNTDYFREYLWRERKIQVYDAVNGPTGVQFSVPVTTVPAVLPTLTVGYQRVTITLTTSTTLKPGDHIIINNKTPNVGNVNNLDLAPFYSDTHSRLLVVGLATDSTLNDQIIVEIAAGKNITHFAPVSTLELYSDYGRFVQLIGEISGVNNVRHPDRAYTETVAHISYQYGQIPYSLWNVKNDNNYKPNSVWPILASEYQGEIQGGEIVTNPILTNPGNYPGDIWAQFDVSSPSSYTYKTKTGNILKRSGDYYGVTTNNNTSPTLLYPDFDGQLIDGLQLNLNINDYAKAVSYTFPIESFLEFCGTAFNNEAPKDFEFNAILWFYTIEDTSGNEIRTSTNLYGIEFVDTPENDNIQPLNKNWIPTLKKYVSNGYQDGSSYTFSLDLNYAIDSDVEPPSFDPDKVYTLFGMELFYEALTRLTYFNDQVTNMTILNESLKTEIESLKSLVYTQQSLESVRSRMDNLENLLNVYSTLQIGNSSTIVPMLDTSVSPPLLRLNSVDKQYGYVYQYNTRDMFSDFINVNTLTEYSVVEKNIPIVSGKDFLVIINNNDYNEPSPAYDNTILTNNLRIVLDKDLEYKQKIDIFIIPKNEPITNGESIFDKGLDLYMNYNDGLTTSKELISKFNLPVNASLPGRIPEYTTEFTDVPKLQVESIKYFMPSAGERELIITVDDDLVYSYFSSNQRLRQGNRIYLENFFLNNTPSTPSNSLYTDLSGQYEVHVDPTYQFAPIYDIEVIDPGLGYDPNLNNAIITITIGATSMVERIFISTDGAGRIISAKLNTTNYNLHPSIYDNGTPFNLNYAINASAVTFDENTGTLGTTSLTILGTTPTTNATFKFKIKKITKLRLLFKEFTTSAAINQLLTTYDTYLNINSNQSNEFDIKPFTKVTPSLTFLKGWKISLTRISDALVVPINQIKNRYNILINKL